MKPWGDHQRCPKKLCRAATTAPAQVPPSRATHVQTPKTSALVTGSSPPISSSASTLCSKPRNFTSCPFTAPQPGAAEAKGAAPVVQKQVGTCSPVVTTPLPAAAGQQQLQKSPGASSPHPRQIPVQNLAGCHRSSPPYMPFAVTKQGDFNAR